MRVHACAMADLFQFEPHDLGRNIQRESSRVAPMEIRPPGFLIRGWSQEMWFRLRCSRARGGDALIAHCTDRAAQTDGRRLPPDRPRRPPTCKSREDRRFRDSWRLHAIAFDESLSFTFSLLMCDESVHSPDFEGEHSTHARLYLYNTHHMPHTRAKEARQPGPAPEI